MILKLNEIDIDYHAEWIDIGEISDPDLRNKKFVSVKINHVVTKFGIRNKIDDYPKEFRKSIESACAIDAIERKNKKGG